MEGFAVNALQLSKLNLQPSIIDAAGPRPSMLGGRRSGISFGGDRMMMMMMDYPPSPSSAVAAGGGGIGIG